MVINRDLPLTKTQRRDCRILSPKWNIYIASLHSKARDHCRRWVENTVRTRDNEKGNSVLGHKNTATHIIAQRLWQHAQTPCNLKPDQTPVGEGKWTGSPTASIEFYATDSFGEKSWVLFCFKVLPLVEPGPSGKSQIHEYMGSKTGLVGWKRRERNKVW